MITDKLYSLWGTRIRACGTFTGFGRAGRRGQYRTLRFEDVIDPVSGDVLWEHTWIKATEFDYLMRIGDMVSFDARVCSYQRTSASLAELGFGLDSCSRFWTESHGNGMRRCLFRKEPQIIEFKPESLFAVMAA